MHLVGFIIRIYHNARPSECQIHVSGYAANVLEVHSEVFLTELMLHVFRT